MRIAFFTDSFPPTHDGVARETDALARALRQRGHPVHVVTVGRAGLSRDEVRNDGVTVRRVRSIAAPGYPQYRIALSPGGAHTLAAVRRSDVVHVHTPGFVGLAGFLLARGTGTPVLSTYHTDLAGILGTMPADRGRAAFYRRWARFALDLCRASDAATAPTARAAAALAAPKSRAGAPEVVPNGVELDRFGPAAPGPDWPARLGSGRRPLVTYLGRLTRDKGVLTLLDATERLPPEVAMDLVIGGEGPQAGALRERIDGSPLLSRRVRLVGPVDEEEKPALLAQSAVFVLPSTADTSSVAVLEAMACGTAVVASRVGGPREIVQDGETGLTVDPRDPSEIARAIGALLGDPLRRAALGRAARNWAVAHASVAATAGRYLDLYARIGAGRGGANGPAPTAPAR